MRMHRGGTSKQPDAPSVPEDEPVPYAGASTASPSSKGPASMAASKGPSTRASSRGSSIAEEIPEAAASPQTVKPPVNAAKPAFAAAAADRSSVKHRAVSRSLTSASPAFAFGSIGASVPKVSRSTTGLSSATPQSFTFGSTTGGKLKGSGTEASPLQLGLGKAADAAASAGNVVGHLFGFSAADSSKARSGFGGGGVFGGLGSGFSFAAGNSSAGLPSTSKGCTRGVAVEGAAARGDGEQEKEEEKEEAEALHAEEEDREAGEGEDEDMPEEGEVQGEAEASGAEGKGENLADAKGKPQTTVKGANGDDTQTDTVQEAEGKEDECSFALPDDLLSGDEDIAAAAATDNGENGARVDSLDHAEEGSETHSECGVDGGQHAEESKAAHDGESSEHGEDDAPHARQDVTGQGNNAPSVSDCIYLHNDLSWADALHTCEVRCSLHALLVRGL